MNRPRSRRRGAVSLELVLMTPIFLMLLDVAVLGGRLSQAQSAVDSAAHAAARAASLQRTVAGADHAARTVAADTLPHGGSTCATMDVNVDTGSFRPGGVVLVTVRCDVALSDLAWLPLPGSRSITGSATSAVDTFRGLSS